MSTWSGKSSGGSGGEFGSRQSTSSGRELDTLATSAKFRAPTDSYELAFPSTVYDEYIQNNPLSISPRDKLSFVDDKKQWKETTRYLAGNTDLNKLTRMIQTEVIRCKPDNILDFINDEFFSLENQTRLRHIFND